MKTSKPPEIHQVKELLAEKGYDVAELDSGLLRARDLETCPWRITKLG
jgi:hypothetical protein